MNFINIQVFWYVPLVLVFMVLLFWRARVRRTNIMRIVLGSRATDSEHVQLSLARRLFRFCILLLAMLMLITAIARPTWKLKLVPYQTRGRDLMVLFDVSKSMLAQDIKPSRLAHAKLFLRNLVEQSGSDRFGLVAFAGRAFLECPMTTDKTSFIQYIDELDTSSIPLGGTNLQLALETALKAFDAAEGNNKAIILITDGDELTGNSKLALSKLKKARIPLLIVGVGSSASPALIPLENNNGNGMKFMRDSKGELVKTCLNVPLMQQLADATGGCFVHSTTTDFGLAEIEAGIEKLLPEDLEKGEKTRPIERFYYFLALATALLWLWMLISEHPGKKHCKNAVAEIAIIAGMFFSGQNSLLGQETPQKLPKNILPETASGNAKTSKSEAEPEPVDPVAAYNKARDLQVNKKGDPSELYATAINLADNNLPVRSKSFNNLGVVKHQQARKQVAQGIAKVRQQQLDGAISQLENAKKVLDRAEEMYIKALSSEASKPPVKSTGKEIEKTKQNVPEKTFSQSAVNQQLLLNDRVMIDELIKKIKELKKQQKKAQKQTRKAQKQQQKKNQQKKQQKQNKDQQKQQQKQQNKQQQQKKDQQKQQQNNKQKQQQKQQNKQQKKDQQKQQQKQQKQQQKKPEDELKKAQNEVKKLQNQAKDLGQKKLENQARKAKEELDKAKKSRKENKGRKAEEHIKKALKELNPQGGKNKQDKKKQKQQGKGQKKQQDKKKQDKKGKDQNKDKNKKKGDKKLPQPQQAQAAKAKKTPKPKDLKPEEARKLLKLMTEKEKDFRKALKARQKEQYKNIKVEKDW
jgi:Ca-activated chloride channel family protein